MSLSHKPLNEVLVLWARHWSRQMERGDLRYSIRHHENISAQAADKRYMRNRNGVQELRRARARSNTSSPPTYTPGRHLCCTHKILEGIYAALTHLECKSVFVVAGNTMQCICSSLSCHFVIKDCNHSLISLSSVS